MLPVRSTTAAASVSLLSAVATIISTARTSSAVRICAGPPALSDGVFWENSIGPDASTRADVARTRRSRTPGILQSIRAEALAIAAAEAAAIAGLVLGPRTHRVLISRVGLFELALPLEIPVARLVLAARLNAFLAPALVPGPIRVRL